jgi:hypothetical protein
MYPVKLATRDSLDTSQQTAARIRGWIAELDRLVATCVPVSPG